LPTTWWKKRGCTSRAVLGRRQKYVLACILALITSLLRSREFGQYFKNSKKKYFVLF